MSSEYSSPPEAYEDKWKTITQCLLILAGDASGGTAIGSSLALPSGQTSMDMTYVGAGASDDDLIQTVTFQPSGTVMTVTYVGSTNNIQNVTLS